MKKIAWKMIWTVIIASLLAIIIFYKSLFFGEEKIMQTQLHITPYTREYFQEQKTNSLYINLDLINKYNQYCQAEHKLCQIFPHQSRIADQIWLRSVQYAGQTNLKQNTENLFKNLDTITSLQPYWTYPYIFAQLFLINKNTEIPPLQACPDFSGFTEEGARGGGAIPLGEKGISYLCNQSGCNNYKLPQALAFNYYYYLQNIEKSVNYYELAATAPGAPTSLLRMPAIVMGRGGHHLKSAIMRYEKALNEKDEIRQAAHIDEALAEYTLNIIQESCQEDIICLQNKGQISKHIQNKINICSKKEITQTREEQVSCALLNYGLDNNFIQEDGTLIYPIDENMTYRRRTDIQDRRIILKTDI